MAENSPTPVKQYTAHIELPQNHMLYDLVGDDANAIKDGCNRILGGGCRFENFGTGTGNLIFHPSVDAGKKAVGWIGTIDVPAYMSNKAWVERRELTAA
jgi:hypothetical protein